MRYFVLITLPSTQQSDALLAAFLNTGWTVSPISISNRAVEVEEGRVGATLAVHMDNGDEELDIEAVSEELRGLLQELHTVYYSILVCESLDDKDCVWHCGSHVVDQTGDRPTAWQRLAQSE